MRFIRLFIFLSFFISAFSFAANKGNHYQVRIPYSFANGAEVWVFGNVENSPSNILIGEIVYKDVDGSTYLIHKGIIESLPKFNSDPTAEELPKAFRRIKHDSRSSALVFALDNGKTILTDSLGVSYRLPFAGSELSEVATRDLSPKNINFSAGKDQIFVAAKKSGEEVYSGVLLLDQFSNRKEPTGARLYSIPVSVKNPAILSNPSDITNGIFKLVDRETGKKIADLDPVNAKSSKAIGANFIFPTETDYASSLFTASASEDVVRTVRIVEDTGRLAGGNAMQKGISYRYDITFNQKTGSQSIGIARAPIGGPTVEWEKLIQGDFDAIKLSSGAAVFPKLPGINLKLLPPIEVEGGKGNSEIILLGNKDKLVLINQSRGLPPIELTYPAWREIDGKAVTFKNIQIEYLRGGDGKPTKNFIASIWEEDISGSSSGKGKGVTILVNADTKKVSYIDQAIRSPFAIEFDSANRKIILQKGIVGFHLPESGFDDIFTNHAAYTDYIAKVKTENLNNLPAIINEDGNGEATFSGYSTKGAEILYSQQVKNLENFKSTMKAGMIGQDIAIDNMYDAAISHYLNPKLAGKPISLFAVGVSGSGKTEFGKTVSEAMYPDVYKDKPAYKIISMGMIREKHEASNVLGGTKSYIGADSPGYFEQALIDMPDGGVILFDEASNIGGESREGKKIKGDIFKSLYEIVDEGKFRSTSTQTPNKVYDLSKYVFIFTGNDAEKLFFGTTAEAKLINIWRENASPEKIKALLQDSNIPNAFLNRLDFIMMFKPLTKAEMKMVAGVKFLHPVIKEFEKTYGVKIKVSDAFIDELVESFYSPVDGARGIRNFVSNKISAAISKEIFALRASPGSLTNLEINLSFREEKNPKRPKIFLNVNTNLAGQIAHIEHDVSPFAKLDSHFGLDSSGNPLENVKLMERLNGFKDKLSARIIGQDYLVDTISDAVYAHFTNPELKDRPLSGMVVGTTGTGKTELGKAIGEALFGSDSDNFVQVLKLGEIKNTADANTLFQAPKGHVDSDEIGLFEQALKKMRNGGVLVFDEASNMGGGDPRQKEALFKLFYDFKEKGKWKSPITNIEYDLSNYVFLYTGNDGQEHFKGMGNDDMRMSVYQRLKSRQAVTATLVGSGTPEPFLGRQDFVAMMKPLVRSEMRQITKVKFLEPVLDSYRKTYGVDFKYNDQFVDRLSKTFFTHEQGARALRPITEHSLGATIAEVLRGFAGNANAVKGKVIELNFSDSLTYKPYRVGPDEAREVKITATYLDDSGNPVVKTKDISGHAPEIYKPTAYDARATAYHEAGHFVVNEPLLTNQKPRYLTIEAVGGAAGYFSFDDAHNVAHFDRQKVVARISTLMAGQMASMMAGYPKDMGWSSDLAMIRKYAREYILNSGMSQGLTTVRVDAQGMPILDGEQMDIFKKEFEALLMESYQFSKNRLESGWGLVRRSALTLLSKGSISGSELEKLRKDLKSYEISERTLKKNGVRRVEFHELFAIDQDHFDLFGKPKPKNPIGFLWDNAPQSIAGTQNVRRTTVPQARMQSIQPGSPEYCAEFYQAMNTIPVKSKISSLANKNNRKIASIAAGIDKPKARRAGKMEWLKSEKVIW